MTITSNKARAPAQGADSAAAGARDFETLFLEYWPRVYGVLLRLVGDPAEAENLAQETFWKLYRHPPPATGVKLGGWLYRVATNLGLNALRSLKRRRKYELEAVQWETLTQASNDPADVAAQAETRARVRRVLRTMKRRQTQLLILRHSGLTYAQIAAAVGVSANSVGTLLVRAEREFEKKYRALGPAGGEDHASQ